MLSKRFIEHVRRQNWSAALLDFLIVVLGIWTALWVGEWAEQRSKLQDLERLEARLEAPLDTLYRIAHERVALSECRVSRHQELSELLSQDDPVWPGSIGAYDASNSAFNRAFPEVVRSPIRSWLSPVWEEEFGRGSFDAMAAERRSFVASLRVYMKTNEEWQFSSLEKQAQLQALYKSAAISADKRWHFHSILTELDYESALLELASQRIIQLIENNQYATLTRESKQAIAKLVNQRITEARQVYGDCVIDADLSGLELEQ